MPPIQPQAKELSALEATERSERCFALDQKIKQGLAQGRQALWETAHAAHEFDEESGWTALGYEKLGDWLADPDVGMARSSFFRLVSTYRELAVSRRIPPETLNELDLSKVQIVLPRLKTGAVKLDDALEDVKALGKRDLREKYLRRPDPADLADPGVDDNATDPAAHDVPLNPTDDRPQWAAARKREEESIVDAVVVASGEALSEIEKPAHNSDHEDSGQLSEPISENGPVLGRADFVTIYQALQHWEDPRRVRTPCPRKEVRAIRQKLKRLIQAK